MKPPSIAIYRKYCLFRRADLICAAGSLLLLLTLFRVQPLAAADDTGLGEKAKATAQQTTETVQDAGRALSADAEQLWQRVDAARLKNRTPDEIVAWVIMGMLVGAVAGMMTSLKPSGFGKLGRLMLGLTGAFLGGIFVRVTNLDFGWGFVLISYEELLFSFIGAILLIVVARLIRHRIKKAPKP